MLMACACISLNAQIVTQPPVPEWIQHPAAGSNQPVFFRRTFEARLPLLKVILLGASEGRISVIVNGQPVGEINGRERATSLDVTRHIQQGQNVIGIRASNPEGVARFSLLLELNGDLARKNWLKSDSSWWASLTETKDWTHLIASTNGWVAAQSTGRVDAHPEANPFDSKKAFDAYDSWKLALGANAATDPGGFTLRPGFKAELLRSAQPDEGSWIALAFDPAGRLTLAREKRGLIRLVGQASRLPFPAAGETPAPIWSTTPAEVIEDTLLECRGLLYAHDALYVNANNSKGFYRLRDTKGDGRFDEVKLLLRTEGGVGHGRNHIVLGPDSSLYLVHGNNVNLAKPIAANSPLQHYQNDNLIPCPFDDVMFDGDVQLPAGHILRTDADGSTFELFAGGFRNPLDIAFNRDGEMFTFDADMEWDVGSPWYRPNRVNHVVSGADFGWRRGTAKWPDYFPETLPSTLDIGLASPTGIEFGTRSHFPPPYDEALFLADWAYGRILAVHLKPNGASYTATSELFVSGRPLNVTDLTFGPDGAMYFITGGRGTQSGLYRISYAGPKVIPKAKTPNELAQARAANAARELRRQLESLHQGSDALNTSRATNGFSSRSGSVLDFIWPHLANSDAAIRHAARVALEHQDLRHWQSRALIERKTEVALTAWLALARVGTPDLQKPLIERLNGLRWPRLSESEQLQAFRVFEVAFSRMGASPGLATACREKLEPLYPAHDWRLNHRLCVLLIYLQAPSVRARTLEMLSRAERPEDYMQYLFYLRYVREGWTLDERRAYFQALERAEKLPGAREYYGVLKRVRDEVTSSLTLAERGVLTPALTKAGASGAMLMTNILPALIVREWRMEDFDLTQPLRGRSFASGKSAFTKAQCILCHRSGSEGGVIGPDLSAVGSRYDRRSLLESILEPSKVIDEKFRNTVLVLKDGSSLIGAIEREDDQKLSIREGPFVAQATDVPKQEIARREPSAISPMPAGLANVLGREEILDLLAFLGSSGNTNDPVFDVRR